MEGFPTIKDSWLWIRPFSMPSCISIFI